MQLVTTYGGELGLKAPGAWAVTAATIPAGVTRRGYRTSHAKSRRTSILNGRFAPSMAWYDYAGILRRGGISTVASSAMPAAATAGAGVLTGEVIYYLAPMEMSGAFILAEGSTGTPSNTLTTADEQATVTIPGAAVDTRQTHWRLYRSDDGDVPSHVADIVVGTTTFTDNVATAARGTEVPVYQDGSVIPESRNPAPFCRFVATFQQRVWYAGDPDNPHRLYFSQIGEGEAVAPTAYRDTPERDAITGIGAFRDSLVVFTLTRIYLLQGYGPDDFLLNKVVDGIGCCSHHSIAPDQWGRLWFWSPQGAYMFDGIPHFKSKDMHAYFRGDYAANHDLYDDSVGMIDTDWNVYALLLPQLSEGPTLWPVASFHDVTPDAADEQPAWSFDYQARPVYGMGSAIDSGFGRSYFNGGADGVLRKRNVATNSDDAGDEAQKPWIIKHGHLPLGGAQAGPRSQGGGVLVDATFYMKQGSGYTITAWGGDDSVDDDAVAPSWGPNDFAALTAAGKTSKSEKYVAFRKVQGTGATVQLSGRNTTEMEYRGATFGIREGVKTRPYTE